MELENQVAVVTGAGRGIGHAVALELAGLGADIVVTDLNGEAAEDTAAQVTATGLRALALATDVTSAADRKAMVDQTLAAFGRIDVLVNNAGIYREFEPLATSEDDWDHVLDVNAKAVFFCAQAVLPTMLATGGGAIVNVSSITGKGGSPHSIPYGVSKAAVISLTQSLAKAYAGQNIRVNCVCPGFVDTEMWATIDREVGVEGMGKQAGELWQELTATIPLGRAAQPTDVARVIGFLASARSGYMTGQSLNVTGGLITH
jgi:NAD(P)-dependent dehydrogenase (short-subunit alcohol dehydrogenase family)